MESPAPSGIVVSSDEAISTRRILRPRRRGQQELHPPEPKQSTYRSPAPRPLPQPIMPMLAAAIAATLPLELLVLVLALLPLPGRLRACALVCKRWRCAAARTVDSIKLGRRSPPLLTICTLYPCLTRLHLPATMLTVETLVLPAALRTLEFSDDFPCSPLMPPPVTLVSLTLQSFGSLLPFLPWLTALRTSLTKLCVRLPFPDHSPDNTAWATFLREWHFPSLTSLRMTFNAHHNSEVVAFLERHSAQLTSLYLLADDEALLHRTPSSFPVLRKLCFNFITPGNVCTIVEASPRLTALYIHFLQPTPNSDILPLWTGSQGQATLVSLVGSFIPQRLDLLLACPRLKDAPYAPHSGCTH